MPAGLSFVEDESDIRRQLNLAADSVSEAYLQFMGHEQKFAGAFIEYRNSGANQGGFVVQLSPRADLEALKRLAASPNALVLIYSKKQFIGGVHADILSIDSHRVVFGPVKRMFTFQRRGELRWMLTGGYEVWAEFGHPQGKGRVTARVLDISAGGVSLHIEDRSWLSWLEKDRKLSDLSFTVQNQRFSVGGLVKSQAVIPSGSRISGFRVGIQFTEISQADREWLESYVLTQSAYSIF